MSPLGEKIRCYCVRFRGDLYFYPHEDKNRKSVPVLLEAVQVFPDTDGCFNYSAQDLTAVFGVWSITKKCFIPESILCGVPDSEKDALYVRFKVTLEGSFTEKTLSDVAREYGRTLEYFDERTDNVASFGGGKRFENFLIALAENDEISPKEAYSGQAYRIMRDDDPYGEDELYYEKMVAKTWILEMEDKDLYSVCNDYIRQSAPSKPIEDSVVPQQTKKFTPTRLIIDVPFGLADCGHEPTEEEIRSRIVNMYESKARSVVFEQYGFFPSRCNLARHEALFSYAHDIYWSRRTIMIEVEVVFE